MSSVVLLTDDLLADGWNGPGPWWPFIPLFWLAFVVLIFFVVGRFGRGRCQRGGSFTGESRLAERFAAGEIDQTEYRERLAILREKR